MPPLSQYISLGKHEGHSFVHIVVRNFIVDVVVVIAVVVIYQSHVLYFRWEEQRHFILAMLYKYFVHKV